MEDASLSNWFQVNDHQGNKGQKRLLGQHVYLYRYVCAHRSKCVFVFQTEYERWKYGREGGEDMGLTAVVWLEASRALHRDPF